MIASIGDASLAVPVLAASLLSYVNFGLVLVLAGLFTVAARRMTAAQRALETATKSQAMNEERIARMIDAALERELVSGLSRAFEEQAGKLKEMRDDLRGRVRRELKEEMATDEFHAQLESVVYEKLTRGAFTQYVKSMLDDQYRELSTYLRSEVVPKAMQESLAETTRILLKQQRQPPPQRTGLGVEDVDIEEATPVV